MSSTVVAALLTAVVSPAIIAAFARYTQRDEQTRETLTELRSALDDAANALTKARLSLEGGPEAEVGWAEARRSVRFSRDRLHIRLGTDHHATRAYENAVDALDKFRKSGPAQRDEAAAKYSKALETYFGEARSAAEAQSVAKSVTLTGVVVLLVLAATFAGGYIVGGMGGDTQRAEQLSKLIEFSTPTARTPTCAEVDGDHWRCRVFPFQQAPVDIVATVLSDGTVELARIGQPATRVCCVTR